MPLFNSNKNRKLLSYGHQPVVLVVSKEKYKKLMKGKLSVADQNWQRISGDIQYIDGDSQTGIHF